jgi:hypothetical protein
MILVARCWPYIKIYIGYVVIVDYQGARGGEITPIARLSCACGSHSRRAAELHRPERGRHQPDLRHPRPVADRHDQPRRQPVALPVRLRRDPEAYLGATITRIVQGHPESRSDELLPWAYTA